MNAFFYDSCIAFFQSLLPGIFLGAIYDIFRILRIGETAKHSKIAISYKKAMPKNIWKKDEKRRKYLSIVHRFFQRTAVFFQDILFWVIVAIVEIVFVFYIYNGEIRLYSLFISMIGFLLYHNTIGVVVMYFAKHIFLIARLAVSWLVFIVLYPIVKMLLFCRYITNYVYKATFVRWRTAAAYKKQFLWSEKKKTEILLAALDGFES